MLAENMPAIMLVRTEIHLEIAKLNVYDSIVGRYGPVEIPIWNLSSSIFVNPTVRFFAKCRLSTVGANRDCSCGLFSINQKPHRKCNRRRT